MSEKPILFNSAMVRAILDGRKTQTRRVIKPQPNNMENKNRRLSVLSDCPYGQPGGLLWVRETWQEVLSGPDGESTTFIYAEDYTAKEYEMLKPWNPSIYMPKSACRLWLKITDTRVERVQDLTEGDAKAEGVIHNSEILGDAWCNFKKLWDLINAKRGCYSWESNPRVWVVSFEREKI